MKPRALLLFLILALLPQPGAVIIQHVGAAATPVKQILTGWAGTLTANATTFAFPVGENEAAAGATETDFEAIVLGGTIDKLYVNLSADVGGNGENLTATLRLCPARTSCADTTLTCTITGAGATQTTCSDTTHTVSVSEGDTITLKLVTTATIGATLPRWAMRWTGTNSNEFMLHTMRNGNAAGNSRCSALGNKTESTSTAACSTFGWSHLQIPAAGYAITGLYVLSDATITAGCQRLTAQVGGANSSNTIQVDLSSGTYATDTTGSISLSAGDRIGLEVDPGTTCGGSGAATPTASRLSAMLRLTNTSQKFILASCNNGNSTATQYYKATGGVNIAPTTSTTLHQINMPAMTATDVAVMLSAAPTGATKSYTHSIRAAGSVGVGCTVTDTATACTGSGSTAVSANGLVDFTSVPANTPTTSSACISIGGTGS